MGGLIRHGLVSVMTLIAVDALDGSFATLKKRLPGANSVGDDECSQQLYATSATTVCSTDTYCIVRRAVEAQDS